MNRIGIITVHTAHNYGAVLQAYALQVKLNDLGCRSEIIDYSTPRAEESKKLFTTKLSIGAVLHNLRTLSDYKNRKIRYIKFEDFIHNDMKLSEKKYKSASELTNENFCYDTFITGSDQTFNLHLGGNIEDRFAFYLNFAKDKKRISYASSFGEHLSLFNEQDIMNVKKMLAKYSAISLREQSGIDFVKKHMDIDAELAIDPAMLLTKDEWENNLVNKTVLDGEYILYYSVLADSWSVDQAKRLSKATKLPVVAPHLKNSFELSTNFIRLNDIGPKEFIGLIKNAKFICTTSFHGTVFSIIFNKPFYALEFGAGARLKNLLTKLNLNNRLVKHNEDINVENIFEIDYKNANQLLAAEREKSINFLKENAI